MNGVKESLKGLGLRELSLVVLCALMVYLFRAHDSYLIRPVWRKMSKPEHFENGAYPTEDEALPSPRITDLESDGINEVLLITNDLRLSVLAMPDGENPDLGKFDRRVLPHVVIKASVHLRRNVSQSARKDWPVAMETGYLVPYKSVVQVRKQVIVIVMDSWTVLCYDHELRLLWSRQLLDMSGVMDTYSVKAMGVLVSPLSVQKDDQGLVIVGGSFSHRSHHRPQHNRHSHGHSADQDLYTHFSTFALSGQDGTTRWQHLPGDFDVSTKQQNQEEPFHWKLGLKTGNLHVGESPWIHYHADLLEQLPHSWTGIKSTNINLANIKKQSVSPDQSTIKPAVDVTEAVISALGGDHHIIGYAYGGLRPHSHHEHVQNANVVIIHNHNGLEVLKVQTGQPVTRLALPECRCVFLDLDKDTVVEKISFKLVDEVSQDRICRVEAQSLMGRMKKKTFQTTVCDSWRFFWGWTLPEREDTVKHLSPLVIHSVAQKRSILQHLLGHHLVSAGRAWDVIVTTSSGRVTSLSSSGSIQWQVDTPASWVNEAEVARDHPSDDKAQRFYSSFKPSMTEMALQIYGKKDSLVLVGWKSIVLVDLKKGRLLGEHSLPCQPTDAVVIGDFDNDGWNDVILTCPVGYIGFSIHKQTNHVYTAVYGAGVFLGVLMITWCLMSDQEHLAEGVD